MKAIICAAGEGKRLRPYTKDNPKCLVKIGDKTIIEHMLDNISEHNISEVIIVVGYKKDSVINRLGNKYKNCNIGYITNEDYIKTNNMYSLWLAMKDINEEIIFFNADILFNKKILKNVLDSEQNSIAVASEIKEDSMRAVIYNNTIKKLGKNLVGEVKGDAVGIYKLSREAVKEYFKKATEIINNGDINCSFVEPINLIADKINFQPVFINEGNWMEIDDLEDYEKANEKIEGIIF
ncbi:MAG: phosphocholine cytidylyltransferase family protein [Nanoarchaeota archaeon]